MNLERFCASLEVFTVAVAVEFYKQNCKALLEKDARRDPLDSRCRATSTQYHPHARLPVSRHQAARKAGWFLKRIKSVLVKVGRGTEQALEVCKEDRGCGHFGPEATQGGAGHKEKEGGGDLF